MQEDRGIRTLCLIAAFLSGAWVVMDCLCSGPKVFILVTDEDFCIASAEKPRQRVLSLPMEEVGP